MSLSRSVRQGYFSESLFTPGMLSRSACFNVLSSDGSISSAAPGLREAEPLPSVPTPAWRAGGRNGVSSPRALGGALPRRLWAFLFQLLWGERQFPKHHFPPFALTSWRVSLADSGALSKLGPFLCDGGGSAPCTSEPEQKGLGAHTFDTKSRPPRERKGSPSAHHLGSFTCDRQARAVAASVSAA